MSLESLSIVSGGAKFVENGGSKFRRRRVETPDWQHRLKSRCYRKQI